MIEEDDGLKAEDDEWGEVILWTSREQSWAWLWIKFTFYHLFHINYS